MCIYTIVSKLEDSVKIMNPGLILTPAGNEIEMKFFSKAMLICSFFKSFQDNFIGRTEKETKNGKKETDKGQRVFLCGRR